MRNSYTTYLKSKERKLKREEIFSKKWKTCELCKSEEKIHVHHKTYENLYNENLEDLMVLCSTCHRQIHNNKKEEDLRNIEKKLDDYSKKTMNDLDHAIYQDSKNKRYPFRKSSVGNMRQAILKKLGIVDYKNLLLLEDICINPHDNSINFNEFKYIWLSQSYITKLRTKLKKLHIVKKLTIKEKTARYLNPILSHSWRTNTVLNLFYEFSDLTFAEYY